MQARRAKAKIGPVSARHALRAETRAAHERVDALFGRYDLADRSDYARFLIAHAALVAPLEALLTNAGATDHIPDWASRRRGAELARDLESLDRAVPALAPRLSRWRPENAAHLWGAAYVLEGSRLGARLLAQQIDAGFPRDYLGHVGAAGGWGEFTRALDESLRLQHDIRLAIEAALCVFEMFAGEAAALHEKEAR